MLDRPIYGYWIQNQEAPLLEALGISESGTYKVLTRLQEAGWAEVVNRPGNGRSRIMFQATDAGVKEFEKWMSTPVTEPHLRDELLVRLIVSRRQDLSYIRATAKAQLQAAFDELAAMRQPAPTTLEQALERPWRATAMGLRIDLHARQLRARVDWLSYLCELLEALSQSTDDETTR